MAVACPRNIFTGIYLKRKPPPICAVIGELAVFAAGSVVTSGVQPFAVVAGNPARVTGFANTPEARVNPSKPDTRRISVTESKVRGVRSYDLPFIADPGGNLRVGEFSRDLPFVPQRYFITFDVPGFHLRGEHAHRVCEQFLITSTFCV